MGSTASTQQHKSSSQTFNPKPPVVYRVKQHGAMDTRKKSIRYEQVDVLSNDSQLALPALETNLRSNFPSKLSQSPESTSRLACSQDHVAHDLCLPFATRNPKIANLPLNTASFHIDSCSATMVATVQQKAPFFTAQAVVNGAFKEVTLDQYKGKYLVLFFYPLDFTFVCPTEIIAFSDRIEEFKKIGVEVVAASVDSQFSHLAWTKQPRSEGGLGDMKIPIIADITKTISRDYGVLVESGSDAGVALRGTFIIDPHQIVRVVQINDLPIGRSVDEVLRLIDALQFHEKHGDVCPVGWKKGSHSMKADPIGSKAYFEKEFSQSAGKRKNNADSTSPTKPVKKAHQ
ncbi:cTPxI [Batrachochytrium dendrobatidis]|nr:cTPxI [Batrachochytrium dendrobatidis]